MTRNTTIFVVDDDNDVRRSLGSMLESTGYDIDLYESGVDFLDDYQADLPGCILMDIVMPNMSGLEVLDRLSSLPVASPIIVMTGQADVPMAINALESGAFSFIEKPFRREELVRRIESAIVHDQRNRKRYTGHVEKQNRLKQLTPREREVLDLVVDGRLTKQIAKQLGISTRTVETHRGNIMGKLGIENLAELVSMVIEWRLSGPPESDTHGPNYQSKRPWREEDDDESSPNPPNSHAPGEPNGSAHRRDDSKADIPIRSHDKPHSANPPPHLDIPPLGRAERLKNEDELSE